MGQPGEEALGATSKVRWAPCVESSPRDHGKGSLDSTHWMVPKLEPVKASVGPGGGGRGGWGSLGGAWQMWGGKRPGDPSGVLMGPMLGSS